MGLKQVESQAIEFKSDRRDVHFKVISAFANADGGSLIIGIDDDGNPVGIKNPKKLLENILNKVRNKLGIIPFVYKDKFTEEFLQKIGLNERQIEAVMYVKAKGKITNKEYQEVCNTSERTATRDLMDLVSLEIFEQIGVTGKGTKYKLKTP